MKKSKTIKKLKHVTFFGGNGNCTNHIPLFSKGPDISQPTYGGKKNKHVEIIKKKCLKKKVDHLAIYGQILSILLI